MDKQKMIDNIVLDTDAHNREWLRNYLEKNIDDIIESILAGNVLKHGFRGLEVKDEMKKEAAVKFLRQLQGSEHPDLVQSDDDVVFLIHLVYQERSN